MPKPTPVLPRSPDNADVELAKMHTPFAHFRLYVDPSRRSVRLFISGSVQPGRYVSKDEEEADSGVFAVFRKLVTKTEDTLNCTIFLTGFDLRFDLVDLDCDQEDLKLVDNLASAYHEDQALERSFSETRKKPGASAGVEAQVSVPGVSLTGTMTAPAVEKSVTVSSKLNPSHVTFHGEPILDFKGLKWRFYSPVMELESGADYIEEFGKLIEAMHVRFEKKPMGRLMVTGANPAFSAVMYIDRLDYAFRRGDANSRGQEYRAEQAVKRLTKALQDGFLSFKWEAVDDPKQA